MPQRPKKSQPNHLRYARVARGWYMAWVVQEWHGGWHEGWFMARVVRE